MGSAWEARAVSEFVSHLVSVGCNAFYDQQIHRSASYLLALMRKQSEADTASTTLFAAVNDRVFEACAQFVDFACYASHLINVEEPDTAAIEDGVPALSQ